MGLYEGLVEFSDEQINILTNGVVDQTSLSVSKSQAKLEKAQAELLKIGTFSRESEELELEVIDDEALTEAVLSRVVERLLKKN